METRNKFNDRSWKLLTYILAGVCALACAIPAIAQTTQPAANVAASQSTAKLPPPPKWPAEFNSNGNKLVIYQPQIRDWQKFKDLTCDAAVSVTPAGAKPVLGIASFHATTLTDTQARIVLIKDISVTSTRFPSLDAADAAAMDRRVRQAYHGSTMTISLDRMLAGFKSSQTPRAVSINTEPPPIFVSMKPAILLFVDGDPLRVPIADTELGYVVNTTWDLLYDKTDYYLLDDKLWLTAKGLGGPWSATTQLPSDMMKLPADQNWKDVRAAVPPPITTVNPPQVFFSAKPAELLLFSGKPVYTKIAGTSLSYASNTENDVFMNKTDGKVYALLSGRWFRADSLQGPWSYAGNDLPKDFAKIPSTHERARVLVSVPGTQAARDAVLLAQVPTTAIVNRAEAEAKVKVVYAGEPQFKPIGGTSLTYAVNTDEKIVKVGDLYYLCFQGVWFMATSPNGPWKTADSVPQQIYEIPSSSPVYNITYVTQTNPTPTTVESSYTEGYMGMFVLGAAVGACIAYGTGYYYPPYYYWGPYPYPYYHPYPYSYGYRAAYNPATGGYAIGGAVYGPYGAAGRAAWYNPATGTYGRAASVQTAYGGRTVAQGYNPYTGTYGATSQGHNAYAQWGSSVVSRGDDWARTGHISTAQGGTAGFRTSDGAAGRVVYGQDGAAGVVKTANNNVYAGKDGNVYKRDSSGNWSKYDNGNWTPVEKSGAAQSRQVGQGTTASQRSADLQQRAQSAGISQQSVESARQQHQGMTPSERSADLQQRAQSSGITRDSLSQQRAQGTTPAAERERVGAAQQQWGGTQQQRWAGVSGDTQRQLNQEAMSRQVGAQREQMRTSGSWGGSRSGSGFSGMSGARAGAGGRRR